MKRELLFSVTKKDLKISYFSGSGAGGQHRNKHQNCVRMQHLESGASSTGQSHKERRANLREAFKSLVESPQFKVWQSRKTQEVLKGKTIEEEVDKMMAEDEIKVEFRNKKKQWVESEITPAP